MPTLNELMCAHTTLCFVPGGSGQAQIIRNGMSGRGETRSRFMFDFIASNFQILPVRFQPSPMNGVEQRIRNRSVALFRNSTLLRQINGMVFNIPIEQDSTILDDGVLHDFRKGEDTVHSPDRTRVPTRPAPRGRRIAGYFHTHPYSVQMRPPTPSADWNIVPGVGRPGTGTALHIMIESNKRVWGLLQNRRAFIVGMVRGTRLFTINQRDGGYTHCWILS